MDCIASVWRTLITSLVAGLLLLSLLLAGCSVKEEKPRAKPPVLVGAEKVMRKNVPVQVRAIGNVEAYSTVSIKAQVNGMLDKVHFQEGSDVKQGQLLFTIDPRPFESALRQAKAVLARDVAQEKFARGQLRRYAELLRDGIVTQDQYDQLQANADALAETVRADRATVDAATIQLGYCFIRSPIEGRTGNLLVRQGNLVRANDEPVLVTINRINPIYVSFAVPENKLTEIKRYMAAGSLKVEAFMADPSGPAEQGVLSFIDNMVDATTGTIRIKGIFDNKQRRLWPGRFVDVTVTLTSLPNAVVAPSRAIQTGQEGPYVFVIKPDRSVETRPVVIGEELDGETVVLRGVAYGESVVTDGHLRLTPGAKVEIRKEPPNVKANPS
jgi:membrane fusion protein, multidrug efflux system